MHIIGKDTSLDGLRQQSFSFCVKWLEFCFDLGVDHSLVFLLLLTWDTGYRLCVPLSYVPFTLGSCSPSSGVSTQTFPLMPYPYQS